jgi:hypothetical protein
MQPEIDIYFFDELSREWMSYACRINDPGSYLKNGDELRLLPFTRQSSLFLLDRLNVWFSYRTVEDDGRALRVTLERALAPPDLAIIDARDEPSITMLERDQRDPGYFQERDIVAAFGTFLSRDQVLLNSYRRIDGEEFADVVAGTETALILVQAKDSPNTAKSLSRTLHRKEATSDRQLSKAVDQMKGCVKVARDADPIQLTIKRQALDLHVAGRSILCLILITEIYPAQRARVVSAMSEFAGRGDRLVVLDYPAFCAFVHHFPNEARFVAELNDYAEEILRIGQWVDPHSFLIGRFLGQMDVPD